MSISPITVLPEVDPIAEQAAVQNNPAVQAEKTQAEAELQPTQEIAVALQNGQQAGPVSAQGQIQQLFLSGESAAQIASETGLSVEDVDLELGIATATTGLTAIGPAEPTSTASTTATTIAAAQAAYGAGPDANGSTTTVQSETITSITTLSVVA